MFERSVRKDQSSRPDARGAVTIQVMLRVSGKPVKGNKTWSVTVKNATVGEVSRAISEALFGTRQENSLTDEEQQPTVD